MSELLNEKEQIMDEILSIYDFLNYWLNLCSKEVRTILNRPTKNDLIARKKVNRLEQLTNRLHIINDKLELMGAL